MTNTLSLKYNVHLWDLNWQKSNDTEALAKKSSFNLPAISVANWAAFCSNKSFICLILKFSVWASSNCCSKDCSSTKKNCFYSSTMLITFAKLLLLRS